MIVRQFLDYVFLYDGADYVDNSAEADTLDGTPFDGLKDANDKLYLGKLTRFKEAYFDFAVNGSYGTRTWEYWNGSAWSALVVSGTAEPMSMPTARLPLPRLSDWAQTMVNSVHGLFYPGVRGFSVTTPATVNEIRQNGVLNTDYTLDAGSAAASGRQDGRLARISGGMFADGEEVKVSFSYATWTSFKMGLFTGAIVEGSARLEMHPLSGMGIQHDYIFPKAVIKPGGSVPFDDTKWMEVPFELQVLDDSENNPDYPMGYILSNETS